MIGGDVGMTSGWIDDVTARMGAPEPAATTVAIPPASTLLAGRRARVSRFRLPSARRFAAGSARSGATGLARSAGRGATARDCAAITDCAATARGAAARTARRWTRAATARAARRRRAARRGSARADLAARVRRAARARRASRVGGTLVVVTAATEAEPDRRRCPSHHEDVKPPLHLHDAASLQHQPSRVNAPPLDTSNGEE